VFRSVSIVFAILLLYSSVGFVLTFEYGTATIRMEVKDFLRKEKNAHLLSGQGRLVTLKFHRSATIHFKDEGKEIYLKGQMYDILQREQKGDSLLFLCFHDVEESKLVAAFEEEMKAITEEESSNEGNAIKSFKVKQEYVKTELLFPLKQYITLRNSNANTPNPILICSLTIPYPPPEIS